MIDWRFCLAVVATVTGAVALWYGLWQAGLWGLRMVGL